LKLAYIEANISLNIFTEVNCWSPKRIYFNLFWIY